MPRKRSKEQFLRDLGVLERAEQARGAVETIGVLPPPLPAEPQQPPRPAPEPSFARDLAGIGRDVVKLSPLGVHPLGTAAITGLVLGKLAAAGMGVAERARERRLGTPLERAEQEYRIVKPPFTEALPHAGAAEAEFQQAYHEYARRMGLDPNPDNPLHRYDYRRAFLRGQLRPHETGHLPSEFKLPGHPRTFVSGMDTRTGKPVKRKYR